MQHLGFRDARIHILPGMLCVLSVVSLPQIAFSDDLHIASGIVPNARSFSLNETGEPSFDIEGSAPLSPSGYFAWGSLRLPLAAGAGTESRIARAATPPSQYVLLSDGSRIAGQILASDGLQVVSPQLVSTSVTWAHVRGVLVHPPANPQTGSDLVQQLESDDSNDRVWLRDGQVLAGILQPKFADGEWDLQLKSGNDGPVASVPAEKVQAFAMSGDLFDAVEAIEGQLTIGTKDGSLFNVRQAEVSAGGVKLILGCGVEVRLLKEGFSNVCFAARGAPSIAASNNDSGVDPAENKEVLHVQLLGDSVAASYKQSGQSLLQWPLGQNADCSGRPLRIESGVVPSGISLHATSRVAYKLKPTAEKFHATLCLPQRRDSRGVRPVAADVEILVARSGKLEPLEKISLDGDSNLQNVSCDLRGAQLLVIAVRGGSEGTRGEFGAEVHCLNARIAHRTE